MSRILIVEDELIIREPFEIVLRTEGYKVDSAINGAEALELCQKNAYDLILLDIMMPVMNGVEFLDKAVLSKNSPKTRIVVMSNLAHGAEVQTALELGAHLSVLKAKITPSSLIDLVKEQLAA